MKAGDTYIMKAPYSSKVNTRRSLAIGDEVIFITAFDADKWVVRNKNGQNFTVSKHSLTLKPKKK